MGILMLLLIVLLSCMLLCGDYFIKFAVGSRSPGIWLIITAVFWCSSIYGWYYTVKDNRIAMVGMLFSVISLVGSVLIGMLFFNERLSTVEWIGLAMGVGSAMLLSGKL